MRTKKVVLLVGTHGQPSIKEVFKGLNVENSELIIKSGIHNHYIIRKNPLNLRDRQFIDSDKNIDVENCILLRWGNYIPVDSGEGTITYNRAEVIKNINDKGVCRKLLAEKGVAVPKTFLSNEIDDLLANDALQYPLIGRPSHHGRGANFYVCENGDEVRLAKNHQNCSYFAEVYPKTAEYRVHIGNQKILAVMQKPAPENIEQLAWNRALNDKPFEVVDWRNWKNSVCRLALKAMDAAELTYGCVDVMYQKRNENFPKAVVCEINTAGTINSSPYVLSRWIKYFNWLVMTDKRRRNWDCSQFQKVESLAWKNFQFEDPNLLT